MWLVGICISFAVYTTTTTAGETLQGSDGLLPEQEIINQTLSTEDEIQTDALYKPSVTGTSESTDSSRQVQCTTPFYKQTHYYIPVPGPPGFPGLQGRQGEPGIAGLLGTTGYSGNVGNAGNNGIPGPAGQPGITGQKGGQGFKGPRGIPGLDGVPGVDGYRGGPGNVGPRGSPGPDGKPGARGTVGPQGELGSNGLAGKSGPPGLKGIPGTYSVVNAWNQHRAFSVALTSNIVANDGNMIIKWDHEFSNVGGDFDMKTGIFNVTVPGTYFFSFHVSKTSRQNYPLVQLVKNGERVVGAIDYGPNDSEDSSGNSVILSLSKNNLIWMILGDERELSSTPYKLTTFSGFLIFPMPI